MMDWLVTGGGGLLGREVLSRLAADGVPARGLSRAELDITDRGAVLDAVASARPRVVVNCAAYTGVDAAEADEAWATRVNGDGAAYLAEACSAVGARLLHVSTDYVFPGDARVPYAEDAAPRPLNAYGRSKLAGERAVMELLGPRASVVRTAWLYGRRGASFVETMLRLQREQEIVEVVDDLYGQPTWSAEVAARLILLGRLGLRDRRAGGVWHAAGSGHASWFELAQEVFRLVGADPRRVRAIGVAASPGPAPRPPYTVLGQGRWREAGLGPLPHWRTSLAEALAARQS
ncbi:dTDP-4-dehydrorhamnose reductase [Nonomuraea purpurea]|uniref:dTDP-4-dehydrorhamnose reductase n=1 Tax=Nonomuraea purpurea TaxID=1849276 RepID=A0ABV8GS84_9ACTN